MNACIKDYEGAVEVEKMTDKELREHFKNKYPRLSEDEEPETGDIDYDL